MSGGQPWGLRSHTVLHGGVECGGVRNKPERRHSPFKYSNEADTTSLKEKCFPIASLPGEQRLQFFALK